MCINTFRYNVCVYMKKMPVFMHFLEQLVINKSMVNEHYYTIIHT